MRSTSKRTTPKRIAAQLIVNAATLGAFVSLGAIFSHYHLVFDLISHFRVQYIVLLILGFIVAMFIRRTGSLMFISLAMAIHGFAITMSLLPVSASVSDKTDFVALKVLNSNLLLGNAAYEAQLNFIDSVDPDIMTFEEYSHEWDAVLSKRLTNYPYRAVKPTHDSFGIALYSKFPIVSGGVDKFSQSTPFVIDAKIDLGNRAVRVIAVHPPPPISTKLYNTRNELMQLLALKAKTYDDALIVMGDFNATPWTSHFSNMESTGRLRNTRAGHGLHPTWPNNAFPLQIPIDHILINRQVGVAHFASQRVVGSDHRTIWSRLLVY